MGGGGTHASGPGPQVYNVELQIKKVVLGDRGDYRLEVKAKDMCDSCSFNIDVEGTLAGVRQRWWVRGRRGGGEAGLWMRESRFRGWGIQNWGNRSQV